MRCTRSGDEIPNPVLSSRQKSVADGEPHRAALVRESPEWCFDALQRILDICQATPGETVIEPLEELCAHLFKVDLLRRARRGKPTPLELDFGRVRREDPTPQPPRQ